jgi:hypothetical protein
MVRLLVVVHQFVNSLALINSFVPDMAVAAAARLVRSAPGGLLTRGKGNGSILESGGGRSSAGFPIPTSLAAAAGRSGEDELLTFPVSRESPSAHAPPPASPA